MNDFSTKERILFEAHKLFANGGLHGVSVRDIATASDVNVAAINYHFKNKEQLFSQTIISSMLRVQNAMKEIYEQFGENDPTEFSLKVLDYFLENSKELRSIIIMISSSDDAPKELIEKLKNYKGPPGSNYLQQSIKNIIPDARDEDLEWVSRSIFGIIMHKSMIMCNQSICNSMQDVGITTENFRQEVARLMKVMLKDIR